MGSLSFSGYKVRSHDQDGSKQKNISFGSANFRGGGGLRDELKECLRRRRFSFALKRKETKHKLALYENIQATRE